ncbi:MAG: alpha/beta hydrolase [Tepidisphaerales bacterium]
MGPIFFFLAVLLVCGTLAWAAAVAVYAARLLSPPRLTDGKALYRLGRVSPADLGLPFVPLQWTSADGLTLRGWAVPAERPDAAGGGRWPAGSPNSSPAGSPAGQPPVAVLVHGYADAKVGALAWATLFRQLGLDVVLPDLRGHGDSDGRWITAGVREADDLARLLDRLAAERSLDRPTRFILFGASLGGAAAVKCAAGRDDVAAIVLDSPVPTFRDGALAHAQLLSLAGPAIVRPALRLAEWLLHVRFHDAAVERRLPDAPAPALVILPADDPFLDDDRRARLLAAAVHLKQRQPLSRVVQPPGGHLTAMHADPAGYAAAVHAFLRQAVPNLCPPPPAVAPAADPVIQTDEAARRPSPS